MSILDGDEDVIGEAHFADVLGAEELELPDNVEELLQKEIGLLSTLIDGSALAQHLEDNYLQNLVLLASALQSEQGSKAG